MDWQVTAFIASILYNVCSTIIIILSFVARRKEKKGLLNVDVRIGLFKTMFGLKGPELFISAYNIGNRPVTISSFGLIVPKKNDRRYMTFFDFNSNLEFPYEVYPGKSCEVWQEPEWVANNLKSEGFTGKVKVKGFYRDQTKREYRGKKFIFDIDEYLKNN